MQGIGARSDFNFAVFHLVSLYIGKAQTKKLANDLEYGWSDTDPFVRSKLADRFVQDFLNALTPFDYEMTEYAGDQSKWAFYEGDEKWLASLQVLQNGGGNYLLTLRIAATGN